MPKSSVELNFIFFVYLVAVVLPSQMALDLDSYIDVTQKHVSFTSILSICIQ